MKIATFETDGDCRIGLVHTHDSKIFDLARAADREGLKNAPFNSMLDLIDAADHGLENAADLFERHAGNEDLSVMLDAVELLAPLPRPRQVRDASLFGLHVQQGSRAVEKLRAAREANVEELERLETSPLPDLPKIYREIPIYYISNRFSVGGPESTIRWPRYSTVMDYEMEFGVITKGSSANINASDAAAHIFGFTIFNDFSARDIQAREMTGSLGPTKGKSFDGGNVLGPWIVTPDELGDPYALNAQARVNGEIWSRGTTSGMLFSFEELIAYISKDETIVPGEFLGSGTLGNGCGLELGRFLTSGDVVELEFDRLGVLRNTVMS